LVHHAGTLAGRPLSAAYHASALNAGRMWYTTPMDFLELLCMLMSMQHMAARRHALGTPHRYDFLLQTVDWLVEHTATALGTPCRDSCLVTVVARQLLWCNCCHLLWRAVGHLLHHHTGTSGCTSFTPEYSCLVGHCSDTSAVAHWRSLLASAATGAGQPGYGNHIPAAQHLFWCFVTVATSCGWRSVTWYTTTQVHVAALGTSQSTAVWLVIV
jgi:hypothetical protein